MHYLYVVTAPNLYVGVSVDELGWIVAADAPMDWIIDKDIDWLTKFCESAGWTLINKSKTVGP